MKKTEMEIRNKKEEYLIGFVQEFCESYDWKPLFRRGETGGCYVIRGKVKEYDYEDKLMGIIETLDWKLVFVPYSDEYVELFKIEVKEDRKRSGIGTEVLNDVLDISDRTGLGLKLIPYSFKTEDSDYLMKIEEPNEGWNKENVKFLNHNRILKEYKESQKNRVNDTYFLKDWYRSFGFKSQNPLLSPYMSYKPIEGLWNEQLKMVG